MTRHLEPQDSSENGQRKDISAFALLIESGAISFIRSIQIVPVNESEIEFRCLFKAKSDMRNHLLRQVMSNSNEAFLVADTLIDIHLSENPSYDAIMQQWRAALANRELYTTTGVHVFCM